MAVGREGDRVPRVHLLATGGTIASRHGPGGLAAATPAAELLATTGPLPGLSVTTSDLGTVGSFAFTTSDLRGLVAEARRGLAQGGDGGGVTQGTDPLEESAPPGPAPRGGVGRPRWPGARRSPPGGLPRGATPVRRRGSPPSRQPRRCP